MARDPAATVGVYRGANDASAVTQFESWLGHPVARTLDYFATQDWSKIATPDWWLSGWSASAYSARMVYSVPLIPDSGGTLQQGAAGDYNNYFITLAKRLVAKGEGSAVLRLGWEFNGDWYKWSAASDPGAFAEYWRQVVTAMRSVPGAAFKFDWCPSLGTNAVPADKAYPGDAYVDYIGLDVYDWDYLPGYQDPVRRWQDLLNQPYGLIWQRDFAAAHAKQMTYPEWALATLPNGHGGGDDPYFITQMHNWIAQNNIAYNIYFDPNNNLADGKFPNADKVFLSQFGTR